MLREPHYLCRKDRRIFTGQEIAEAVSGVGGWGQHEPALRVYYDMSPRVGFGFHVIGTEEVAPTYTTVFQLDHAAPREVPVVGVRLLPEGGARKKFSQLILPAGLVRGRSFLEVASLDGRLCLFAERVGAERVACVDYHAWGGSEDPQTHLVTLVSRDEEASNSSGKYLLGHRAIFFEQFRLMHCLRGSRARAVRVNAYDLHPTMFGGLFDVVYAGGLLYHAMHPLLMLQGLRRVTKHTLVVETERLGHHGDWSLCRFYRDKELNNDSTNFFGCNPEALAAMAEVVGLRLLMELTFVPGPAGSRATLVFITPEGSPEVACAWDKEPDCGQFWGTRKHHRLEVYWHMEEGEAFGEPWKMIVDRTERVRDRGDGSRVMSELMPLSDAFAPGRV